MNTLNSALEKVKQQMADPSKATADDSPPSTNTETTMATKKGPKKKAAKKAANGHAKVDDGLVSLKQLAGELKIEPRLARVKLRKAEIENPGRWAWKEGSGELTKVRKLLSAAE